MIERFGARVRSRAGNPPEMLMGMALRGDLSFSIIGERAIFLDLAADRYFCLGPTADGAFQRFVQGGESQSGDDQILTRLLADGLFVEQPDDRRPSACPPSFAPSSTMLDRPSERIRVIMLGQILWRLFSSSILLRIFPLRSNIQDIRRRKETRRNLALDHKEQALSEIVAAFEQASQSRSKTNQCLVRSVAMARLLLDMGINNELVFGVTTRPFRAHCWVQRENVVLNDSLDNVRAYSPILVI